MKRLRPKAAAPAASIEAVTANGSASLSLTESASEKRTARAARKVGARLAGTLAAMTVLRHALAADARPTPHTAVMAVAVPSAMDRRDRPVINALKARQGRLRWSRLAARRGDECESRCDRYGAQPGQQFLHRCPPFRFVLNGRA